MIFRLLLSGFGTFFAKASVPFIYSSSVCEEKKDEVRFTLIQEFGAEIDVSGNLALSWLIMVYSMTFPSKQAILVGPHRMQVGELNQQADLAHFSPFSDLAHQAVCW